MNPGDFPAEAEALCNVGRLFGERGWCLATSGNFSIRVANDRCMITQSGVEKSRLEPTDLMICDLGGKALDESFIPSAETALHTCIYHLDEDAGAVLHTHSVFATVLSRTATSRLELRGFEMQKALRGVRSHDESIELAVFDNDQDMPALAKSIERAWTGGDISVPGFLIKGHGLYAWGSSLDEAQRHVEGLEFLLQCAWQEALARSS